MYDDQQQSQNHSRFVNKKKTYSKPSLTQLGKVAELTAGGSGPTSEVAPGWWPIEWRYKNRQRS